MDLLPPPPLRLDERLLAARARKTWGLAILVFLLGVGFLAGAVWQLGEVLQERGIWSEGKDGEVVQVDGKVTERVYFAVLMVSHSYDLQLTYLDAAGATQSAEADFELLFSSVDPEEPLHLRYDLADPSRIALSAAIERPVSRAGFGILMLLLGPAMIFGGIATIRRHRRQRFAQAQCAMDGVETIATLEQVQVIQNSYHVSFRFPDDALTKLRKVVIPGPPLVVETETGEAGLVTVRSPLDPELFVVIEESFAPFVVNNASHAA